MQPFRVRDPRGLALGLLFVGLALFVIVLASGYRPGTALNMGPGYFPRLLGGGLLLIGLAVIVQAFRIDGEPIEWRPAVRPALLLALAILLFALSLQPLGMVVSIVVLMLTSALASPESRPTETLVSALVVAAICGLVFVTALGVQVPLWPWFLR